MKIDNILILAVLAVLLASTPVGHAGDTKTTEVVTGKVVSYEPQHNIVVDTGSHQKAELNVTKDTALQDKSGNTTSTLQVEKGATVKIEVKGTEAKSIKPVPDVAGPDFNPTPHK